MAQTTSGLFDCRWTHNPKVIRLTCTGPYNMPAFRNVGNFLSHLQISASPAGGSMKTWRDIEELADRTRLAALIDEQGTPLRISRFLGCSLDSVRNAMRHHGLKAKYYRAGAEIKRKLRL